jgi:hypothetical protein
MENIMTRIRNLFLVGAAAAAVAAAGAAGAAAAQIVKYHELNVQSPDGAVAHIRYAGDRPPQVRFDEMATPTALDQAFAGSPFSGSPFGDLERISAAMDQQAAALFDMANGPDMFADASPGALQASLARLPAGTEGYSVFSVSSGGKTCTEQMRYGYDGQGKLQVQRVASGACDTAAAAPGASPAPLHVKAPQQNLRHSLPGLIEAAL